MERRTFLKSASLLALSLPMNRIWAAESSPQAAAATAFAPTPDSGWRVFELVSRLNLPTAEGVKQAWVPLPSVYADDWMRPMGNLWQGNASQMQVYTDTKYQTQMLHAVWDEKQTEAPMLEVTSRFATRDRAVDFDKPGTVPELSAAERALYTEPTELLPTDGIVRETAEKIVTGKDNDLDRARAIYDWIVENTVRDPKVEGCGIGDIRWMLETGNLKGKCADLNALYVGLARAAGLPARDVYGLRVADSRFGYHSLGKSGDVSKGQHCRAEVFLSGFGWTAVDPADVRKVMLEENKPDQLGLDDPKVVAARKTLFGGWETNWLAYNVAHDLALPGSTGKRVPFLMYPQAETANGERLNGLKPDTFSYTLTSREVAPLA
ncbi:transglutaminase-like domain-containing protein [Thiothrix nivea]|uniref:Transglutaminase domain-containing protein n=1 Tax=Thiothrix nivea (strain ATCC 35100 / DSM 5205 / JP2) TaxID=870187 RepID=A0A656HMA7_THINJ|nr:transglutaminase domain-containing protein [Thiothrix nivea]EIJ36480.1 transglutaminase domain-containing protein [Thiothrix nivea DSM 5205]